MKRIAAVLAVVVALSLVAYWFFGRSSSATTATQYLTSPVTRGNVTATIAATGTVQAATTYALAFGSTSATAGTSSTTSGSGSSGSGTSGSGTSGSSSTTSVVTRLTATAGRHVKAGDVLAVEDNSTASTAVTTAQAGVSNAQAQLASAESQLTATEAKVSGASSTSSQVASAQAQLSVDQAQLTVDRTRLSSAQATLAADLAASPAKPATVIAADRLAVAQAQQAVSKDQAAISADQQAVAAAESGATAAANAASVAQARAQVTQARNGVVSAQASLATARKAAAATSITAPAAGVVTVVNLTLGQAPPSGTAVEMRSDALTVVANVAEQDEPELARGLVAQVNVAALNATVPATVSTLPAAANASSSGSGAVTFPLVLSIAAPPKGLLPGMTASIAIATASATQVLEVPTSAIQGTSPNNTVQVMVDGTPQSTPVNVGLSTNATTEIISGVSEGQVVVTGVVNPTATTTTGIGGAGLTGGGTRGGGFGGGARPGG